jgi:hypothetical protein
MPLVRASLALASMSLSLGGCGGGPSTFQRSAAAPLTQRAAMILLSEGLARVLAARVSPASH